MVVRTETDGFSNRDAIMAKWWQRFGDTVGSESEFPQNSEFADITIKVSGGGEDDPPLELRAHRCILAVHSAKLRQLFLPLSRLVASQKYCLQNRRSH